MTTVVALALVAFCTLPRSQCADLQQIADLLHASIDKANSLDPGHYKSTAEAAQAIYALRKKLRRDLHLLERGLLSGNEGRMSALIAIVKSSVEAVGGDFQETTASVSTAWSQTSSSVLHVLLEVERMLKGNPGWTPSWHFISQFVEEFLYDGLKDKGRI